jgi:hypothetical protein
MLREDLMSPDLLSEIVLLGSAALIVVALLLMVVAAFTQPTALAWRECGEPLRVEAYNTTGFSEVLRNLNKVLDPSPRVPVSDVIISTLHKMALGVAA